MPTPMSRKATSVLRALRTALVTAVALTLSLTPGAAVPLLSDLVAWWPGEGNANDVVGLNNGALGGGATATAPGRHGRAFSFDGVNDQRCGCGWVTPATTGGLAGHIFFHNGDDSAFVCDPR